MTLGGLALAVGILVDEATVEDREHPHADSQHTPSRSLGRCGWATRETAVPRLLAHAVRSGGVPAIASSWKDRFGHCSSPSPWPSAFAMIASSYFLSSTFVPVLSRLAIAIRHVGEPRASATGVPGANFGR